MASHWHQDPIQRELSHQRYRLLRGLSGQVSQMNWTHPLGE
jgi:hypothetical protein